MVGESDEPIAENRAYGPQGHSDTVLALELRWWGWSPVPGCLPCFAALARQ
jgi:hypothetical protein